MPADEEVDIDDVLNGLIEDFNDADRPTGPLADHEEARAADHAPDDVDAEVVVSKRAPRAKLDSSKLLGRDGLISLQTTLFPKISFKGKGHEQRDLDKIIDTYMIWAHKLFPKANFNDFIETTRKLGSKTEVKNYRMSIIEKEMYPDVEWSGKADHDEPPAESAEFAEPAEPAVPEHLEPTSSRKAPIADDEDDIYAEPTGNDVTTAQDLQEMDELEELMREQEQDQHADDQPAAHGDMLDAYLDELNEEDLS